MSHRILTIIWAAALVALASCNGKKSDRATVTVSIEPQRWLVEQIAGDRLHVNTLMERGADPENFDPTLQTMQALSGSIAYFSTGRSASEKAITDRIHATHPDLPIIDTSKGIALIIGTHGAGNGVEATDPHIWNSIPNMRIMADNVARELVLLDPEGADTYRAGYKRVLARIDSLQAVANEKLMPLQGATVIVRHPSLSYFVRNYNMEQLALETEGKETTPAGMASQLDKARNAGAVIMIVQPSDNPQRAAELARQAGVPTAEVNLLDYDWISSMSKLIDAIAATAK